VICQCHASFVHLLYYPGCPYSYPFENVLSWHSDRSFVLLSSCLVFFSFCERRIFSSCPLTLLFSFVNASCLSFHVVICPSYPLVLLISSIPLFTSCDVPLLSSLVLSCYLLSSFILFYPLLSSFILSCPLLSSLILFYPLLSSLIIFSYYPLLYSCQSLLSMPNFVPSCGVLICFPCINILSCACCNVHVVLFNIFFLSHQCPPMGLVLVPL
jgi:hypothetical protein